MSIKVSLENGYFWKNATFCREVKSIFPFIEERNPGFEIPEEDVEDGHYQGEFLDMPVSVQKFEGVTLVTLSVPPDDLQ